MISKRKTSNALKMSDVAAELGLSRVAVSAVVNGRARKAGLPERTERRVLEYLKKRGYVPSRNACHLRSAPDCVIGIMHVGNIYSHLTDAFHRLVKTLGSGAHGLEIVMTPRERIEETVREVAARRVTHLVWIHNAGLGEEYRWQSIAGYLSNVRTVIYNFPFNSPLGEKELLDRNVAVVGIDRTANTRRLARFLKRLGHRIIALPDHLRNDNTRHYFEAFETEGLAVADCPLPFTAGGMRKAMNKHGVTAACFRGDNTASLAICGLRAAGVRVPEDLTVTGFDGMSRFYNPDLTTQVIPVEKMVAKIRDLVSGEEKELRHCFDLELVKGKTHGPPVSCQNSKK